MVLDHGDGVTRGGVEGELPHARDGGAGRHGDDPRARKAARELGAHLVAESIDDEDLELNVGLCFERGETSGQVVERVDRRHDDRELSGHRHRRHAPDP